MNLGGITIDTMLLKKLMDLTDSKTPVMALDKSIGFTLLHEKDTILEALK